MANLLDLMSEKDRENVEKRFKARLERRKGEREDRVSSEMFLLAEFGHFYGWGAIMAVRENKITLKEMYALLEAARKVWYSRLNESAEVKFVAGVSANAMERQGEAFRKNMRPFIKRAEIGDE